MLIALLLANALVDEPPLLRAQFDLSAVHELVEPAKALDIRGDRYRAQVPELRSEPVVNGVQIRLRWKRIRMRMPIPSI